MDPTFRCTSCDVCFEASAKPRCPVCFRVSTVVSESAPSGTSSRRIRIAALVLVSSLAVSFAGWALYGVLAERQPLQAPPVATQLRTDRLGPVERAWQVDLLAADGPRRLAKETFGADRVHVAVRYLGSFLQDQRALGNLTITRAESQRRPPLDVATLTDGVLSSIFAREGAYLSSTELTLLLAALADHAGLAHDVVVLEPVEPTFWRRPVVAVRFLATEGRLALDPETGELRRADRLVGYGAELLWAFYYVETARYLMRSGRASDAAEPLERARSLAPDAWLPRAVSAERLLDAGDDAAAREMARGLASETDHPYGWYCAARAGAAGQPPQQARAVMKRSLANIVESFPAEAVLAVELGDLHAQMGEFEDARDMYELALRRKPTVRGAHTGLADLYARSDSHRAMQHARAELAVHPDYAPAYAALATIHTYEGAGPDVDRAITAGRAVSANPEAFARALEERLARARQAHAQDISRLDERPR